jgi:hypothetical protein
MSEEQKKCECCCSTDKYGFWKMVASIAGSVASLVVVIVLALVCSCNATLLPAIFQSIFGR